MLMVLLQEMSHDIQTHGHIYQQQDLERFFKQSPHRLGFVAHLIHLCFQARMSDASQLAPQPRL